MRVGLDDIYDSLWRIEVVGKDGENLSEFSVESFKKVQEQYIVKRITLSDLATKDAISFEVKAAALRLSLNRKLFDARVGLRSEDFIPKVMQNL